MANKPLLLAAVGFLFAINTQQSLAELPPGFTPLFNNTDLTGWHGMPHFDPRKLAEITEEERAAKLAEWNADAAQHWTVENGELVNDGHGAYLITDKHYGDYEFVLDYKTVALADSGIYLKGTPQIQIWDYTKPGDFKLGSDLGSGGLWNNSPGSPGKNPFVLADNPFGEWNSFRVRQVGARTTVWLNDMLVVNHATMENYWDRKSPLFATGPIELQTHGGEIRWRNLGVKELTSDEANAVLSQHEQQAFRKIFNGADLTGWTGATENYEVVDAAIQCKDKHGGNLFHEKEYANFIARVEFRLPPGGNNGLAIRAAAEGDVAYSGMTELQILDVGYEGELDDRQYHGSAYGMVAAHRGYLRETGQWNFQEVTVDGSTIKVELNGNVILNTDLSKVTEFLAERPHPGKDRPSGFFGFAGHNDPVAFRNISIKELPASPVEKPAAAK